ncbi:MAG: UDP-N-acetylmuramate dehydrogenase [Candidatus Omnitrophica bacterium]|nr:UDP-N-acetylmuramate dehydrogenase [Candidatus Omnitrophota bacterium]
MIATTVHQELVELTGGRVRFDEPMRLHTSFHIGGPAEAWVEPQGLEELRALLAVAASAEMPVTPIGAGANLLVRDGGIPGLVVSLNTPAFRRLLVDGETLTAGAGVGLDRVVAAAREAGLGGCEFLAGIPGKVGGAVRMNAGTRDGQGGFRAMSDVVARVTVVRRDGTVAATPAAEIGFEYRRAALNGDLVVEAVLQLAPRPPEEIGQRVTALMAYKRATQDLTAPSAGCIFKNPGGGRPAAGRLIDQAGLKGMRVGDAIISPRHANFIVNLGEATAGDVLALISAVQYKVMQEHGVFLELEVQVMPQ